ncbi:helix-turn-helix domain-containing protein [Merdimonas faecis]|uniref:helix-turn-helix domain-containing protein n=1 Tax=Merdimonas faecis TaxID=1653435 RepID=UPI0023F62FFB|nr:helix-turn-helix domain-containing protein [Merdimonas faecis]
MKYNNPIYRSDQPYRNVAVYQYLRDRAGKKGYCWPSIRTIAEDIGMSKSTVKRGIADLAKQGFIRVENRYRENGGKTSNLYRII